MADVKWIKITTDMFEDNKIRLIDAMPESDAILTCWVRLLCLAGSSNFDGKLYVTETMAYTDEMLATIWHRPISVVRLALETFEKLGMVQMNNGHIEISNWGKHQNQDALSKIREANKSRQQRFRDSKKEENKIKIENKRDSVTVTLRNTDKVEYANKVHMTETEHQKLIDRYGTAITKDFIEQLSNYKNAKGKTYKSDYHAVLQFTRRAGIDERKAPAVYKEDDEIKRLRAEKAERVAGEGNSH